MISETANIPTIIGTREMPESRLGCPNVKRACPAGFVTPMVAINKPSKSEIKPLSGLPVAIKIAQVKPSSTSQKYSKSENLSAQSASTGAEVISTAVPNKPPITEKTKPAPSAVSA